MGTNVRVGRDEIDLLMRDGATLVAVEVRSSRAGAMVHPLETLGPGKRARMRRAITGYAALHDERDVRIDLVTLVGSEEPEHIANAIDFTST